MRRGLTWPWIRMRRSLAKFSESEASNHTPSLADFTTTTPVFKFSVHTRRQKRLHHKPLRIRRIAFIPQALASIMSTSDFSPGHRALPRIFANPKESQPTEITQLLFQSGS